MMMKMVMMMKMKMKMVVMMKMMLVVVVAVAVVAVAVAVLVVHHDDYADVAADDVFGLPDGASNTRTHMCIYWNPAYKYVYIYQILYVRIIDRWLNMVSLNSFL